MKVNARLIYPAVKRQFPNPSDPERQILIELNIGCDSWKTNTAMRKGFCDLLFAGAGNHPGIWDGHPDQNEHEFDAGDKGINNVHRQWAKARTRSMSVGDLVNIDPDGPNEEFWVCDSVGWVLLTPEQALDWLQYPRQYGCDSFDLRKWMNIQLHIEDEYESAKA